MVDTQGTASQLDSYLRLEKADATLVATSDQNGLYGQDDSFVHVVLPDDGQYYVRVSDYFNSGGASYSYKLHVMFPGGVIPTQPQITSLNPTSGTQGSSTTLIIQGTNLSGATGVTFAPSTGITVSNIQQSMSSAPSAQVTTQVVCAGEEVTYSSTTGAAAADIQSMSPTQITAQVAIAADAPTGARQVTVTTPGGTSNALTFTVNPGGGANYDGTWTGSTGSGTISFTVTNNLIMSLTVTHSIPAGCCTLTKFSWSSPSGRSISGDSFNFTVSSSPGSVGFTFAGTFSSPTQASGTIVGNLQASATMPCCTGSFNLSWSANK